MYTLLFILSFVSFWSLYVTSRKIKIEKGKIAVFFFKNALISRLVCIILFIVTSILLIEEEGAAGGILISLFLWLLCGCIITIFAPFNVIKASHIAIITFFIGVLEISI